MSMTMLLHVLAKSLETSTAFRLEINGHYPKMASRGEV